MNYLTFSKCTRLSQLDAGRIEGFLLLITDDEIEWIFNFIGQVSKHLEMRNDIITA